MREQSEVRTNWYKYICIYRIYMQNISFLNPFQMIMNQGQVKFIKVIIHIERTQIFFKN